MVFERCAHEWLMPTALLRAGRGSARRHLGRDAAGRAPANAVGGLIRPPWPRSDAMETLGARRCALRGQVRFRLSTGAREARRDSDARPGASCPRPIWLATTFGRSRRRCGRRGSGVRSGGPTGEGFVPIPVPASEVARSCAAESNPAGATDETSDEVPPLVLVPASTPHRALRRRLPRARP